jgi:hypothetical protein
MCGGGRRGEPWNEDQEWDRESQDVEGDQASFIEPRHKDEDGAPAQDEFIRGNGESWKTEARLLPLIVHRLVPEDGPEAADSESSSEEHGEDLTRIYAPGCESLDQARNRTGRVGGRVTDSESRCQ